MEWAVDEIVRRSGAVPFRDFMELVLYHPEHGFYCASRPRYGRAGAYLTAPTASEWYASVIAGLLRRLAAPTDSLTLVDVGSGDGAFIDRTLCALAGESDTTLSRAVSIERSAAMRELQRARFAGSSVPVDIASGVDDLPELAGPVVLHACELYDALPVHRVVMRPDGLQELWVEAVGGRLDWREVPASVKLSRYFHGHGIELEDGQLAEANLEAAPLHRDLLGRCGSDAGALLLDYGHPARRLYDPRGRRRGALACYSGHRLGGNPLEMPGQQDLTAHVNWDDLRRSATAAGWSDICLYPLAEFLVRGGLEGVLERAGFGIEAELDSVTVAVRQEIKRLLDPDGMGSDLKILVQATGALESTICELLVGDI